MKENKQLETTPSPFFILDLKKILSPLPILKIKKQLSSMPTDSVLEVESNDPRLKKDIESWCLRMRHQYLGEKKKEKHMSYFISKK